MIKLIRDELLQGNMLECWTSLTVVLKALDNIRVPWCYFYSESFNDVQLHRFSNASEQAFATVLYSRCTYPDGSILTRFVASETRVASVKKQSIPCLELLGALILARLTALCIIAYPGMSRLFSG